MKRTIKNLLLTGLSLVFLLSAANYSLAQGGTYNFASSSGLSTSANQAGYITTDASTIEDIIATIIYVLLGLVGVTFMGFIMYGGITWMTAMGNEEKVKKANKILMASLFGLMITLSAYVLSFFLINYFWK